jgi:hypothetical protein
MNGPIKTTDVLTLYQHWLVSTRETVRGCNTRHRSPMEGSILIALWSRVDPVLSGAQLAEILSSPGKESQ